MPRKNSKSGLYIKTYIFIAILMASLLVSLSCNTPDQKSDVSQDEQSLTVSSTVFEDGGLIPVKYTCRGDNTSPLLMWTKGPAGTEYYVLIFENLDAPEGITGNWILYNIPGHLTVLHDGISTNGILDTGAIQGRNYLGKLGYFGPCPTQNGSYRYRFTIYAVDKSVDLATATREEVLNDIEGHILASGQLTCVYKE